MQYSFGSIVSFSVLYNVPLVCHLLLILYWYQPFNSTLWPFAFKLPVKQDFTCCPTR
jgi:hypothetical protein